MFFFSRSPKPSMTAAQTADARITSALRWEENPVPISILSRETLQTIANNVCNAGRLHYSGNCVLLANLVLYNIKRGQIEVTAGNTSSPFQGVDEMAANRLIFQSVLDPMARKKDSNAGTLTQDILNSFKTRNERVFYIGLDYQSPYLIGRALNMGGHSLNAVVIGEGDKAEVVFLDAWYKKLYTPAEFAAKYPPTLSYTLEGYVGAVQPMLKPGEKLILEEKNSPKAP